MTLEEHAEVIRKAVEAAEAEGFRVEINRPGSIGAEVVIRDQAGREVELNVF